MNVVTSEEHSRHSFPRPGTFEFGEMTSATNAGSPLLRGTRVLVVEDVMDNRLLVRRILERAGAKVACASEGREGVNMARSGSYDVILMDLALPVMDGFEAQCCLRQEGFTLPIIAMTASASAEDRNRTRGAGFNDHIAKPFDIGSLVRTVARWSGAIEWNTTYV